MQKLKMAKQSVAVGSVGLKMLALLFWLVPFVLVTRADAQLPDITAGQKPEAVTGDETATTMFPHPAEGRFWISGQMNFIYKANPPFHEKAPWCQAF